MNRLDELLKILNMSPEEFAKSIGVHRSSIYRYTGRNAKETREMSATLTLLISEKYNINLYWLHGYDVYMYRDITTTALEEMYNHFSEEGKKELFSYAMYIKGKEDKNG